MTADDLAPGLRCLAAEGSAGSTASGSGSGPVPPATTRPLVLVIKTAGLTSAEVEALSEALKVFRRRQDLVAEFVILNLTGGDFVSRVPNGWPPEG